MTENATHDSGHLNQSGDEIKKILENNKVVAIVGLSDNREKDSYKVGEYLKNHGYTVIPVNPAKQEILGEKAYPDLKSVPGQVDIVDIFRNTDAIPGIVDEAIGIKAKVVWMQLGLSHEVSAEKAKAAGLQVVQSKCMKIEHAKLTK
jgi:uncharacterized protein